MLAAIERATRQPITPMQLPTREDVNDQRMAKFKQRIGDTLAAQDLVFFEQLVASYEQEHGKEPRQIAAALAYLAQKDRPLAARPGRAARPRAGRRDCGPRTDRPRPRAVSESRAAELYAAPEGRRRPRAASAASTARSPSGSVRYRIEVGHEHGVQPGNIVGAIANEAGIDSVHIGRIDIFDAHSTVELPEGMPTEIYEQLQQDLGVRTEARDPCRFRRRRAGGGAAASGAATGRTREARAEEAPKGPALRCASPIDRHAG